MTPDLSIVVALLGAEEWIIVLLIVMVFFGAAKIPQLAKSLGRAKGEFEKAKFTVQQEIDAAEKEAVTPPKGVPK